MLRDRIRKTEKINILIRVFQVHENHRPYKTWGPTFKRPLPTFGHICSLFSNLWTNEVNIFIPNMGDVCKIWFCHWTEVPAWSSDIDIFWWSDCEIIPDNDWFEIKDFVTDFVCTSYGLKLAGEVYKHKLSIRVTFIVWLPICNQHVTTDSDLYP